MSAPVEGPETIPFGTSPLERWGERRRDAAYLARARSDPAARLLLISESRVPVDAAGDLAWRRLGGPEDPLTFLGEDAEGHPLFSRDALESEVGDDFVPLREVGAALGPTDAAAALLALGLSAWHRRSPYCSACGGATRVEDAGHRRRCVVCNAGHFPRTDAAVIMLVTAGDRCVLGRRVGAPSNRWSTLAGFVESGESLESAVAREVREEVGLVVSTTRYRGSQPWPFPASLMVAFEADADYGPLTLNHEHQDVRWFTRDEVGEGLADGTLAVPAPISAGGFLIRNWVAGT